MGTAHQFMTESNSGADDAVLKEARGGSRRGARTRAFTFVHLPEPQAFAYTGGTMSKSRSIRSGFALSAAAAAVLALSAASVFAKDDDDRDDHGHSGISQSGEQKDMRRVGHVDLQGRPSYQPNVIRYPDGRTIAFAGTHGGSKPNPLNGGVVEQNGTMIIDVTDPKKPVEKFHIPVPVAGGQAQMARMCLGSQHPGGTPG